MTFQITGPKKFLITALLSGVVGGLILYTFIKMNEELSLVVWSAPVFIIIFALIFFWIWVDVLKNKTRVGAGDIPPKYAFLVAGFLFAYAGFVMTGAQMSYHFLPEGLALKLAYWISSLIFLVPGLVLLTVFFKYRVGSLSAGQIEKAEARIGAVIGAVVGAFTLAGMLVAGIVVTFTATDPMQGLIGMIFTGVSLVFIVLFGVIFYFVRGKK